MPFWTTTGTTHPDAVLRQVGPNAFCLEVPFRYFHETYANPAITVPAALEVGVGTAGTTDLASVPWMLWGLLASHGRQTLPALLHDHLCDEADKTKAAGDRPGAYAKRKAADRLFRLGLADEGVASLRRWLFWTAVSVHRYLKYARVRAALLIVQVVAGVVLLAGAPLRVDGWRPIALLWLVPLVASLVWGAEGRVVALATYAVPVVAPAFLVNLGTALVLMVLGYGWWLATLCRSARPPLVPYRVARVLQSWVAS